MADKKKKRFIDLEEFAQRHGSDMDHVRQVRDNAAALFDETAKMHKLGNEERFLLLGGALVHDVGYRKNPPRHHKVGRDIIMESGLQNFDDRELRIMACMARYHRRALPDRDHRVYRDLSEADQVLVEKLAALLRVADGLDRSHSRSVQALQVKRTKNSVRLLVKQRQNNPDDIEGAKRKSEWFEVLFGVQLEIIAE